MNIKIRLTLILLTALFCCLLPFGHLLAKETKLQKKLNSIIVDHMEFEDVSISAVVNLLREEAKKKDSAKEGINIILLLDRHPAEVDEEEDNEDEFIADEDEVDEDDKLINKAAAAGKVITIMFDDLSLGEAIRNICIAADMNYRVDQHAVILFSKNIAIDKLETQVYPVPMGMGCYRENSQFVNDYFKRRGVAFLSGAKAVFDTNISRIIATNTPDNLKKIEKVLYDLQVNDPQVMINVDYIKISKKDLKNLKKEYEKSGERGSLWRNVLLSDKAETISSASLVTQNGEEATIRVLKEVYFPESWSESGPGLSDDSAKKEDVKKRAPSEVNAKDEIVSSQSMPKFGKPTNLGIRLTVTPTVDPDKYTISVDSRPVLQHHIGWTGYKRSKIVKMPILKVWTQETQFTCYDRDVCLISSAMEDVFDKESKIRERNFFMLFMNLILLRPDGSPLRELDGDPAFTEITDEWAGISCEKREISPLEKKLSRLIVDKINLTDANLQTFIAALSDICLKKDKSIRFSIALDEKEYANIPLITMNIEKMPCLDVIRYICLITGLESQYKADTVSVGRASDDFETKFIRVRRDLISRIAPYPEEGKRNGINNRNIKSENYAQNAQKDIPNKNALAHTAKTKSEDSSLSPKRDKFTTALMKYFIARGVPFPDGTTIDYDKRQQQLVILNTPKNIRKISFFLREMDLDQPQVSIESSIVEISNRDLIELLGSKYASSTVLSPGMIQKIIDCDKANIIASQQVISKNGEEATARFVSEEYFPRSWTEPEIAICQGYVSATAAYPEMGKATDLGGCLIVTPTVSPNNHVITLSIRPQFLKLAGWSKFDWNFTMEKSKSFRRFKEFTSMPKIDRRDLITNIKIYNDSTICIGRVKLLSFPELKKGESYGSGTSWTKMLQIAKGEGEELKNIFFFVSAHLVNPDGKPAHQDIKAAR